MTGSAGIGTTESCSRSSISCVLRPVYCSPSGGAVICGLRVPSHQSLALATGNSRRQQLPRQCRRFSFAEPQNPRCATDHRWLERVALLNAGLYIPCSCAIGRCRNRAQPKSKSRDLEGRQSNRELLRNGMRAVASGEATFRTDCYSSDSRAAATLICWNTAELSHRETCHTRA